jgi:hypothetical protein
MSDEKENTLAQTTLVIVVRACFCVASSRWWQIDKKPERKK